MIECPLTGARLVALKTLKLGDYEIKETDVVEINKVGFVSEKLYCELLSGVVFTVKDFGDDEFFFPVETPYFEELEDLYEDEIINWK